MTKAVYILTNIAEFAVSQQESEEWIRICQSNDVEVVKVVEQNKDEENFSDELDAYTRESLLNETKEQSIKAVINSYK